MSFPERNSAGRPLIAGGPSKPSGEFHDFTDDDLAASNFLDFNTGPGALQSPDNNNQKIFLNPQDLFTTVPDSPNGSVPDSASDSASSKRTGSSVSFKAPDMMADVNMGEGLNGNIDWANLNAVAFDDDGSNLVFAREAENSAINGLYEFGERDDTFMDHAFDFERASNSPAALRNGHAPELSPPMPTMKPSSPADAESLQPKVLGHRKKISQFSMTSSRGQKREASRELSPMSSIVASHNGSPAAHNYHHSPSSNGNMHSNSQWTNFMPSARLWAHNVNSATGVHDTFPNQTHFAAPVAQPMRMPQPSSASSIPPAFQFTGGCELIILPTPFKSRVETQIPIKMTLNPLPPGITRLHLPTHTISKPKLLAKPRPERSPDMLELHVSLVCVSAMDQPELKRRALERAATVQQGYLPKLDDEEDSPQNGGEVRICAGCITRERKRAARKKVKKPDEDRLWSQDEERRVIVFNTQEVKEWQPVSLVLDANGRPQQTPHPHARQIDAPMRIACYCRHHNEKMGFKVIFTIKDWENRVVAQAMSHPIMITDDHKTNPQTTTTTQLATQPTMSAAVTSSTMPAHHVQSMDANAFATQAQSANSTPGPNGQMPYAPSTGNGTPTMGVVGIPGRPLSRPPSPNQGGPAKKRKSSASRVPTGLAMTRMEASPTLTTSPFSPHPNPFPTPETMFGALNGQMPFTTGPPTPNSNDQGAFFANRRSDSMDNLAMAQLCSAPVSNHPSRAPSPSSLRNGIGNVSQNHQLAHVLTGGLYSVPLGVNQPRASPIIHKIIPNEGPKIGGIEVTVLGASFFQGLEVWFGDNKATTTTFWGESSLVCLLPPSHVAGAVHVTFKQHGIPASSNFAMGKQPPVFRYIDDSEDKLIRTALSVLGHKMSGQMVDASELARRILHDGNSSWSGGPSAGASGNGQGYNHAASNDQHLESQLLKVLDLIDLDDSAHRSQLDLKGSAGHTMLHIACSLGYHRFVAALLAKPHLESLEKGGTEHSHFNATNFRTLVGDNFVNNG